VDEQIPIVALILYVLTAILGVAAGAQWLRSHLACEDADPDWRLARILTAAAGASFVIALAVSTYIRSTHIDCCYMSSATATVD
jgi:hypothetical protein